MDTGMSLMRQAIELDPSLGRAYGYLAFAYFVQIMYNRTADRDHTCRTGIENANRAISIDQRDYFAHYALGRLQILDSDYISAIRSLQTAVRINPNFAYGYFGLAVAHVYMNEAEQAIDHINLAIRLSPNDPLLWAFYGYSGLAHFALGELDLAIDQLEQCYQLSSAQFTPFVWLAVCYLHAERWEDAKKALDHAKRLESSLSISFLSKIYRNREGKRTNQLFEAMETLGLKE